jgi:hypothetical protein
MLTLWRPTSHQSIFYCGDAASSSLCPTIISIPIPFSPPHWSGKRNCVPCMHFPEQSHTGRVRDLWDDTSVSSRPETPKLEGPNDDSRMVRLSFRRGGDKALYAALKRSILGRAWQVSAYVLSEICITIVDPWAAQTKSIGQRTASSTAERFGVGKQQP